jgi:hypothetical protein
MGSRVGLTGPATRRLKERDSTTPVGCQPSGTQSGRQQLEGKAVTIPNQAEIASVERDDQPGPESIREHHE